jgi:hypothetical protein
MYSLVNQNIELSYSVRSFLDELAPILPFDIEITSGTRTPAAQAAAMFKKIELGDDLIAVYADDEFAQKIIDAYPNLSKATAIIKEYAAAGGGSSHLRGLGVDIRSRTLTENQIQQVKQAAESLDAFVLVERTPPHIHVTVKKKSNPALKIIPWGILGIVGGIWIARTR